ncbi:YraN family protein [Syntrophomonas erecta]
MKKRLGKKGEDLAVSFLTNQGYRILERNYYTRFGELDIICTRGGHIIFIEVKTRTSERFGTPEEAVTPHKIEHIRRAALSYLSQCKSGYSQIRFDVIAVRFQNGHPIFNHIENAF